VFQRNIVIDNPEKFGLPDATTETNLYVTQIFTSQESHTNKLNRKPVDWKNANLSWEEKSMCTIFHKFNNSVIATMQDDAYRDVMVDFWQTAANRLPGITMLTTRWDLSNMKSLMQVMFATANDIIFEKAASKVACAQRLVRLSSLFAQYAKHFQERKCLPDGTFVKAYEEREKKKMIDLGSFNGMLAEYTATASGPGYDVRQKPMVTRADQATIAQVAKIHAAPAGMDPQIQAFLASEAQKAKVLKHQQDVANNTELLVKIREHVAEHVKPLVNNWLAAGTSYVNAVQYIRTLPPDSLDSMRGEIALKVYAFMWEYETSNPKTPYTPDALFDSVYAAFVNNADNAAWLNREIGAASV